MVRRKRWRSKSKIKDIKNTNLREKIKNISVTFHVELRDYLVQRPTKRITTFLVSKHTWGGLEIDRYASS